MPLLVLGCVFLVLVLLPAADGTLGHDEKLAIWSAEALLGVFALMGRGLQRNRSLRTGKEEERARQIEQFRTLLREVEPLNERLDRLERRWDARTSEE